MIRRIQRKPLLQKRIAQQAENMLVTTLPQEVQEVLSNLNTNLRDVHNLIDSQLRQTQELSKKAYADLRQTSQPNLAASGSDNASPSAAPTTDVPAPPMSQQLGQINAAINARFAAMTEQIGKRSQQVSMAADNMQNVASSARQGAQEVEVESALGGQ